MTAIRGDARPATDPGRVRRVVVSVLIAGAIAVAVTWPVASRMSDGVVGGGPTLPPQVLDGNEERGGD